MTREEKYLSNIADSLASIKKSLEKIGSYIATQERLTADLEQQIDKETKDE